MAKRSGQWFGDSELQTIIAGAAVAQVIQLLPTVASLQSMRDIVFERVIISFQSRRILSAAIEGYAFVVWKGNVLSGTTTPVEALDPLSQSTFSWSHGSIMQYGVLDVPREQKSFDSAGAFVSQTPAVDLLSHMVDFDVKRSVNRANEGIFLKVSADVSSNIKCNITWRTYYTYAS